MKDVKREALRYLGVRGTADARTQALVEEGLSLLEKARPLHRIAVFAKQDVVDVFQSNALAEHLQGCEEAALLAATLGVEADRLILRAEATDTLQAAVLHACAAAKIEAYCDAVQQSIPQAARSRFSPGYGDFPLSMQQKLLDMVGAHRIGLYLTAGCMLAPTKSVTAVMGLGPAPGECETNKCARCLKKDCAFRGEKQPCH